MARLRAIDVARGAGVSVQQVRNYEAEGVLPPLARTEAGYRIFTPEHAAALRVVRLLAEGHGWERARIVMRSVHAGDVATALAELDRSHAELDRERSEIAGVLGAFATLLPLPTGAPARAVFRIGAVADAVGVRTSALRVWERHGLLRPSRERVTGYRVYDDAELRRARVVALLRRGNYPISIVRAVIDELRTTGSPHRVRAELARREQDLHRRSLLRLQASAALYEYLTRVQ
ncbi:MerR family transcriptional regulator [Virgisporangium aurantiacum]|uniref:MerR family transcriptional regulator n=1 Tax=Virgisporangium aurantiacum TaxID=175570 RepID=A0A8J3YXX5_9ACTN|nr:MerR family transcriptional regulator [Virgisporangium aurantiacum]GIJ52668.1 MerR family transcriptional regulator [Virgisporangium aurantiacum]